MSKKDDLAYFRKQVETLRVLCPVKNVEVRRCKLPSGQQGDAGYDKKKRRYTIRINNALHIDFQIWVLIHEWAHCMTWTVTHDRHDFHGAHFGVAYSEAYTAVFGKTFA